MARLEERLGARLFHRNTHSVGLTPEGGVFLERRRRILTELEIATQEISQARMVVRGPIRVSLPTWAMTLMPTFARFMRVHPEARLELDLTDRLVDVIEEGYDLVIRTGDVPDSRLMSRGIGHFRHAIVASPAYLAARGVPERAEDLLRHSCLHRRHPETGKIEAWPLARDGVDVELDLPVTAVIDAVEARIELSQEGLGIACVPAGAVLDRIASGRLRSILQDAVKETGAFRLLWPANGRPSCNIRALVDFIAQPSISQKS